jgi:predicted nucleic acid-binding protein
VYLDTCYLAKFYFNEPDSLEVRKLVQAADAIHSSQWASAELHAMIHRRLREGVLSRVEARDIASRFAEHVEARLWNLLPVTETLLKATSALLLSAPRELFLRTADAVHLTTALHNGEREFWTSDRHMLAAASHFGLVGRSV